jgi:hypothetical protein
MQIANCKIQNGGLLPLKFTFFILHFAMNFGDPFLGAEKWVTSIPNKSPARR